MALRRIMTALLLVVAEAFVASAASPFHLTIVNSGRHTLSEAHLSVSTSSDWGDNLLRTPLGPEQQATVTVSGDCGVYDVRFVAEKGTRLHDEGLTLCEGDTLTISDRTIRETRANANQ